MWLGSYFLEFWFLLLVGIHAELQDDIEQEHLHSDNSSHGGFDPDIDPTFPHSYERMKRIVVTDQRQLWPKGIVPYIIQPEVQQYTDDYKKMMALIEDRTCIRFIPYDQATSRKLGLGHDAYLNLKKAEGCWAVMGGTIRGNRDVSCCLETACLHELGHALGMPHEQTNPKRVGWIRFNKQYTWPDRWGLYTNVRNPKSVVQTFPYDISSDMHYKPWMFGTGLGPVFTILFPELRTTVEYFYMFMELSSAYKCAEKDPCKSFSLTCVNDGYKTVVHGKCACQCPEGLDPLTGCATIMKKVETAAWPKGQYALPSTSSSCPAADFKDGWVGKSGQSAPDMRFCTRNKNDGVFNTDEEKKFNWPIGVYCIFREGGKCPEGFFPGSISNGAGSSTSASVPDGVYNGGTTIQYCCQYKGFQRERASFPTDKPFELLKLKKSCQNVIGMKVREGKRLLTGQSTVNGKLRKDTKLCSYRKADMDCGAIITLDKNNPETTIEFSAAGRTDLECTWLVKGGNTDGTLVLDFEEFDVRIINSKQCKDKVEVRHARIGQFGQDFCGTTIGHSIRSIFNTMLVRFFTDGASTSFFKAKIKWIQNEDLCYNVKDRGVNYAGKVSYTRLFEPCLPWAQVTQCPHHPFQAGDEMTNLEENYCRNPDNSFRPWCYTNTHECQRNYCDVCKLETPYDHIDYCPKLKKEGFCTKDSANALRLCAKTCLDELPDTGTVKKYDQIACPPPKPLGDGKIVSQSKSLYPLGTQVKHECNKGAASVTTTCNTNEEYSPRGFSCHGLCQKGYSFYRGSCYTLVDKRLTKDGAIAECKKLGGKIATPRNKDESMFMTSIGAGKYIWISPNDVANEGIWVYDDGEEITWSNWGSGEPNNFGTGEDCVQMVPNQKWNDIVCTSKTQVVCEVPGQTNENDGQIDFLDGQCKSHIRNRPSMCKDFPEFAKEYCSDTCGLSKTAVNCPKDSSLFNNACYKLMDKTYTFDNAAAACKKLDGYIASPKDNAENDFVNAMRGDHLIIWLGATDRATEGVYVWQDGSSVDWKNWGTYQPDNWNNKEDCTALRDTATWSDIPCTYTYGLVCTTPLSPTTDCEVQPTNPGVTTTTDKASISVGDFVIYSCDKFKYRTGGDEVRGCMTDGKLTGEPLQCEDCPLGYKLVNNTCYGLVVGKSMYYYDAEKECTKVGGFIVHPKTQDENNLISSIGLGEKIWIDPSPIFYTALNTIWQHWADGEPKRGNRLSCTAMTENKEWMRIDCKSKWIRTVCSIPRSGTDICYDPMDNGKTYNGKVNYSKTYATCLPWAQVTQCNNNALKEGLERSNLEENYCRNPDDNPGGPWCYTSSGCSWKPCDVCRVEATADVANNCQKHKDEGKCEKSPGLVAKYCASTCKDSLPSYDTIKNYLEVVCKAPVASPDGEIVSRPKSQYKLGDVVTYKCKRNKFVVNSTCLTSGDWSTVGLACTQCPLGYMEFNGTGTCYAFIDKMLTAIEAVEECGKIGGFLPRPKTPAENEFLTSIQRGKFIWIGAERSPAYDYYRWSDGTKLGWTNWAEGKPKGIQGCAFLRPKEKQWDSILCDFTWQHMRAVCAVPKLEQFTCGDFLETQCPDLLNEKPTMCKEHPEFVQTFCAKTCGFCGADGVSCSATTTNPDVVVSESSGSLSVGVGDYVGYQCVRHRYHTAGDSLRMCQQDGTLTGAPYQCGKCPAGYVVWEKKCYGYINKLVTFSGAVDECNTVDGYVASPRSQAENDFIATIRKEQIWLGATDSTTEATFLWQDGTTVEWFNWYSGEPNNWGDNEDCVMSFYDNTWNDIICDAAGTTARVVCTIDILGGETCYDENLDNGASYNGQVDHAKGGVPCVQWTDASNCPHHPFQEGDEKDNLEENYCRNPDNSLRPWCYTNAQTCEKKYCDVCSSTTTGTPTPYKQIECNPPTVPSDGELVGNSKPKYKLGDVVSFKCTRNAMVAKTTCLTSGDWTPVGFACADCKNVGYSIFDNSCYKFVDKPVSYSQAKTECSAAGGDVAQPKSQALNDYVDSIRQGKEVWLGANDREVENDFVWEDGTRMGWKNWSPGEPNNSGNEDCVVMRSTDKQWNDISCVNGRYGFVCAVNKLENSKLCKDFLDDKCTQLIHNKPTMCKDFPDFSSSFCAQTCGVCGAKGVACPVPASTSAITASTTKASIPVGDSVSFDCTKGYYSSKGNSDRACLPDGALSGTPLECTDEIKSKRVQVGAANLVKTSKDMDLPEQLAYTGDNDLLRIENKGVIVAWEFYTDSPVKTSFQVWRKIGKTRYQLVGQNVLVTGDDMEQRYDVPEAERIQVEKGDLIGIWQFAKGGVQSITCDPTTQPNRAGLAWTTKVLDPTEFKVGFIWTFKDSERSCLELSLRAEIIVTVG